MQKSLGQDITNELEQFVKYMEEDIVELYASSCLDQGYKSSRTRHIIMAKKVGDRLMCTLMTGALFFMNRWSATSGGWEHHNSNNKELEKYIRCAIVNIFMYILLASKCTSQIGINHAWYSVQQMEKDMPGLIKEGKCRQGVFTDIQINDFRMETMIQNWLKNKQSLTDKFASPAIQSTCRKPLGARVGGTIDAHTMDDHTALSPEEKDAIKTLSQELKTIVQEVKTGVMQCAEDNEACMKSIQDVSGSNPDDEDSEARVPNPVKDGTPAQTVAGAQMCGGDGCSASASGDNHEWTVHCTKLWNT
ncbi:hypothetical protein AK88_05389 [Plasmodium fragile]|uniref:Schizont-infected cell agglutination extracellular alpha domain-containing protein n=1 Tax=Plasmodium fragile TaxID=5857 RepID=A0A0D9QDC6_PLAFR|nr:uncharacterized protein AK88_05389 [Plasmodium fragile]KJP84979.1 hypothetical protein AK88_05389 [Plasmodium fragile]